ncbi:MAG: diadenylate cyclase CdaA [Clostridia bacterium]|nr:diadenylate cyclase CdaA [Clostridia bacterium]
MNTTASELWTFVKAQFSLFSLSDAVDILALTALLILLFRFLKKRRAGNLVWGLFVLLLVWGLAQALHLHALSFIFEGLFGAGLLAILIIFQPEIRSALEKIGDERRSGLRFLRSRGSTETWKTIETVCEAAADLSKSGTGALIVLERNTNLGDVICSGVELDAKLSSFLLCNIFFDKAPLHDGAVVVRGNRVCAAGCILPLSESTDIDPSLGTRHRAALGISEASDAVVVVVSEETRTVSVAFDGILTGGYSFRGLKTALSDVMVQNK